MTLVLYNFINTQLKKKKNLDYFKIVFGKIGQRCKYLGKDKKFIHGEYLFTIDWAHPEPNILDTEHSEIPDQHKCAHILALDNGNYAVRSLCRRTTQE